MSKGKGLDSEIAANEVWREAIAKEMAVFKKMKNKYACNLKQLSKQTITEKPTREDADMTLSPEEDVEATTILNKYGHDTTVYDPAEIRFPKTSNHAYGAYAFYAMEDNTRDKNAKRTCKETQYGNNYYQAFGKSAFSNKK